MGEFFVEEKWEEWGKSTNVSYLVHSTVEVDQYVGASL